MYIAILYRRFTVSSHGEIFTIFLLFQSLLARQLRGVFNAWRFFKKPVDRFRCRANCRIGTLKRDKFLRLSINIFDILYVSFYETRAIS